MSSSDEFNELEIETVAAVLAAEHDDDCESHERFDESENCEGDFYHHHNDSGGCLILIAGMLGIFSLIAARMWIG